MLALIRIIAQRVLFFIVGLLAFSGISVELSIHTPEESRIDANERREIIREVLQDENSRLRATEPLAIIDTSKLPISLIPRKTAVEALPHVPIKTDVVPKIESPKVSSKETPNIVPTSKPPVIIPQPVETPSIDLQTETTLPSTANNIVVNIICTNRNGNKISVSTGSGVLISKNGVILTNAHVAQLFLLKNYPTPNYMDCSIRRENIPTIGYTADLLFISGDWLRNSAHLISNPAPRGTGENDYALLVITGSTNPAIVLSSSFPSANIETEDGNTKKGDNITVTGYPGNQLSLLNLTSRARLEINNTTITDVFTFDRITTDVFSTGESSVAQTGSSGGGIFKNNKLIGIIATTGVGISGNFINGITTSYINRDIREESGESLNSMLSGDVRQKSIDFLNNEGQTLINILGSHL